MKVNFKFTNINLNSPLNKNSKIHETIINIIFFGINCVVLLFKKKKLDKLLHHNCLFGILSIYINII